MFDILRHISQELSMLKMNGNYRHFLNLIKDEAGNPFINFKSDGNWKTAINYCSNDYLSMSNHPDVIEAFALSSKIYGVSSGGTRNISGTTDAHISLEKTLSQWHEKEAALLFGSAYMANLATLQTLGYSSPQSCYPANIGEKNTGTHLFL